MVFPGEVGLRPPSHGIVYRIVAIMAERYYIQLVFIPIVVMVVFRRVVTRLALKQRWWVKMAATYSIIDSIVGITLCAMLTPASKFCRLTLRGLFVESLSCAFTCDALTSASIGYRATSVKLRQWKSFVASITGLCYDGFKHDCLLLINSCVRAICGSHPTGGLFYYNSLLPLINPKYIVFGEI